MTMRACPHESEIKRLLELGHWPQSSPTELRAHLVDCRGCRHLVLLTQTFQSARAVSSAQAHLPPAGVIWWRAQLRRRNAAVAQIQRPLFGAQIFAAALALLVFAGTLLYGAAHGLHWISAFGAWMASLRQSPAFHLEALWPFATGQWTANLLYLVPCVVMLLLLGGVVLYMTSEKQ